MKDCMDRFSLLIQTSRDTVVCAARLSHVKWKISLSYLDVTMPEQLLDNALVARQGGPDEWSLALIVRLVDLDPRVLQGCCSNVAGVLRF